MTLVKSIGEIVLERVSKCTTTVSAEFLPAVRAIYGSTVHGRPEHIGTCILLKLRETALLLTAAHVIDNNACTTLYAAGENKLVLIEGEFLATQKPLGDRDNDRYQ